MVKFVLAVAVAVMMLSCGTGENDVEISETCATEQGLAVETFVDEYSEYERIEAGEEGAWHWIWRVDKYRVTHKRDGFLTRNEAVNDLNDYCYSLKRYPRCWNTDLRLSSSDAPAGQHSWFVGRYYWTGCEGYRTRDEALRAFNLWCKLKDGQNIDRSRDDWHCRLRQQ